jgi:hypothetical protein
MSQAWHRTNCKISWKDAKNKLHSLKQPLKKGQRY